MKSVRLWPMAREFLISGKLDAEADLIEQHACRCAVSKAFMDACGLYGRAGNCWTEVEARVVVDHEAGVSVRGLAGHRLKCKLNHSECDESPHAR